MTASDDIELSRRDETPSPAKGRNQIIDDRFLVSRDYQELSSKIGRAAAYWHY